MTDERWISVTAEGEATVAPDLAVVSLSVTGTGRQLEPTRQDVLARSSSVLSAVRALGIADPDLQAPDVAIHPEYNYTKGQKLVGYRATRSVTVRVRDLEKLGPVLDRVVKAGANEVHGAEMRASDPSAAEHAALRAAVGTAQQKAAVIAEAAGVSLGSLRRLEEEPQSGGPSPVFRQMEMASASDAAMEVAPGELAVTRRIRAWFEVS